MDRLNKTVLLGSSSAWRRDLLEKSLPVVEGVDFEVRIHDRLVPDIDEKGVRAETPEKLVAAITRAKTDRVLELLKETPTEGDLLVCGDTVLVCDGTIYEKPVDAAEAKKQLQSYGKLKTPAVCVSAVEVTNLTTSTRQARVEISKVFLDEIPDEIVAQILQKGIILTSAGSLVMEDPLMQPYIRKVEGEMEVVLGLPKTATKELIQYALTKSDAVI